MHQLLTLHTESPRGGAIGSDPPTWTSSRPFAGLKGRLDYLSSLKVKGLVLGPIHKTQKDDVHGTNLEEIDPTLGSREDFENLLQSAKKKSGCLRGGPGGGGPWKGLAFWPGGGRAAFLSASVLAASELLEQVPASVRPRPERICSGTFHLPGSPFTPGFSALVFKTGFH